MKKKILIILIVIVLIVGICLGVYYINKPKKKLETKTYEMYVKINPLVKLVYNVAYEECYNRATKQMEICSDISESVVDFELVNNDAKDIYNEIDFKGKSVGDSLIILCDVARDNHIAFESLEITSNTILDENELLDKIKSGSKYETNMEVIVNFTELINRDEILASDNEENQNKKKMYNVTFDSDGGTLVKTEQVEESKTVTKPANPTKAGYEFVEWQLNNKKYDFKSKVTKDITLKAKWKELDNTNPGNTAHPTPTPNTENNDEPKVYTITFDTKGGSTINSQSVKGGEKVTKPENPTKSGYDFSGWTLNGKTYNFDSAVQSNIKLVATWKESVPVLETVNLNDNILYYNSGGGYGGGVCLGAYHAFISNFDTLFPGKGRSSNGYKAVTLVDEDYYNEQKQSYIDNGWEWSGNEYILISDYNAKKSQFVYDSAKESNMVSVFNSLVSKTYQGFVDFKYSFSDHKMTNISYATISIEGNGGANLKKYLDYTRKNIDSKIVGALKGSVLIAELGGCGDIPEAQILNEAACKEYNLPCGRW